MNFLDQLEDLKAKAERATPGPWRSGTDEGWPIGSFNTGNSGEDGKDYAVHTVPMSGTSMMDSGADCDAKSDAAFIAAANPAFMQELLRRVEGLRHEASLMDCSCSIKERESGHLVGCNLPALIEALAEFEKPFKPNAGGGE